MQRATKLLVLAWTVAALAIETRLVARGWNGLLPLSGLAFAASFAVGIFSRRAISIVLATLYLFPALMVLLHGEYVIYFGVLWMSALLGGMLPEAARSSWSVPDRWVRPLVCWALTVVTGTTITVAREIDFYPPIIDWPGYIWSSSGGVAPGSAVMWVLYVALVMVLGILWFDWLFGAPNLNFRYTVAWPLLASAVVMAAASLYQMFGDITFLNKTAYAINGRAAGTLLDANLSGTLAMLWIGGIPLAILPASRLALTLAAGGVALMWCAVWGSGSRSEFMGAALVTISMMPLALRYVRTLGGRATAMAAIAVLAIAGVLILALTNTSSAVLGPLKRAQWGPLPGLSLQSIGSFAAALWNRDNFGSAANAMIRHSPWFGVGVGCFQILLPDFSRPFGGLPIDNAQNWFRHQLAEFGVVGSLGWIAWVVTLLWFALRRHRQADPSLWIAEAMLLALVAVSFVGMPGQDLTVAMTFWTVAFWYIRIGDGAANAVAVTDSSPPVAAIGRIRSLPALAWWVVAIVLVVYTSGATALAVGRLRVPVRAQHAGWPYSYGFYEPEPDGEGGERRWTARRAVTVLDAPTRWLMLTIAVNHLDIESNPVNAKVWRDGELVMRSQLASTMPVTKYIRIPDNERRIVLETSVNRVVRPSEFGLPDTRALGLIVKWKFVDSN